MVKSGKSFVKIGSCLQIAFFFLFYRNFYPPSFPHPSLFRPAAYLILTNVPPPPPLAPPAY